MNATGEDAADEWAGYSRDTGFETATATLIRVSVAALRGLLKTFADLAIVPAPNDVKREGGSRRIDVTCQQMGATLARWLVMSKPPSVLFRLTAVQTLVTQIVNCFGWADRSMRVNADSRFGRDD